MEHSESDSASVPNVSDPLMGPQCAPSESITSHHDPQPSDLDQAAQDGALCGELQSKLDLKGEGEVGGETDDKVSNFTEVGDEGVKGHDEGVDGGGGDDDDDGVVKGDDDGVKGDDVGVKAGDFVGVNGGDEGIKGGDEHVKGDDEGVKGGDEGVKGGDEGVKGDDEGVNGDDEGVNCSDEGVKGEGGDEDVNGYDEVVKGANEGVKGDDEGVKGNDVYDEGVKGGDEDVNCYDDGVKGGDEDVNGYDEGTKGDDEVGGVNGYDEGIKYGCGDGDSRGWETNSWDENVNEGDVNVDYGVGGDVYGFEDGAGAGDDDNDDDGVEKREERGVGGGRTHQYPWRPEAQDCAFYMKTGTCKYGLNCKFNHPIKRKTQAVKELTGEREEPPERPGQTECKYYLRSGGCKFGKDCKYNHPKAKDPTLPIAELNFLGLPIRLGKRECPYYMRNGSCKFGANCKFNHPDPTTVGGGDPPSGYGNGGISLHGVAQQSVSTWSSPRTINETSPFMPMMLSTNQGVSPQGSDWNGYQAPPVYLSERNMHPPAPYVINNPAIETNAYRHPQKRMQVDEFPERPGETECSYFLKTGDCKFKSNCKFHHPKNRVAKLPPCNLNDKGLPLRPDKNPCSHYARYGICKFGPACKYDHPNSLPSIDQPYTDLASGIGGNGGANDPTIRQSV